jgi:tRNA G18 (ribose-2'-O)-methylase SpoU
MPPRVVRIRSENAEFQHIETLRRNRRKRHRHREFFVEGVRPINRLRANGWPVHAWCYADDARLSDWARAILDDSTAATHYEMPSALVAKLSRKDEPSELIAVVEMPADDLARIPVRDDGVIVLLDRPSSPGNVGTILRSCDALGAHGVIVTGHAIDVYDPEVVAATAGSFFDVPVVRLPSPSEVEAFIAERPLQLVGTSANATTPIHDVDLRKPTLLLVGNETHGLAERYRELAHVMATIPMRDDGGATSLNVATATTVLLYELRRQRGS